MHSDINFKSFGLSQPILDAVTDKDYQVPTLIQTEVIPLVLQGKDLMAAAQTGTGKTAGFVLPLLEKLINAKTANANQTRALILVPTRELAAQVGESVRHYGKHLSLRFVVVYGGVKINPQMMKLRKGADVLVSTPGRLLDLYEQNAIEFNQLEILVLDEADRMLDLGFIDDINRIIRSLPDSRQSLMFSATFSDDLRKLAKGLLRNPVEISVSPPNTTATTVSEWMCPVDKKNKPALLLSIIKKHNGKPVLVFCKTKNGADKLSRYLEVKGINASAIHGNKSQGARNRALASFKQGDVQILVATDLVARGLDIEQLPLVVNFDLPKVANDYIHRIGRTGRADLKGEAVSLVSADEFDALTDIEHLINNLLLRKTIKGFEPAHDVPETRLWRKPKKPKKPKIKGTFSASGKSPEDAEGDGFLPPKRKTKINK
jgi:ATP-dependent RNA helicase RhlE